MIDTSAPLYRPHIPARHRDCPIATWSALTHSRAAQQLTSSPSQSTADAPPEVEATIARLTAHKSAWRPRKLRGTC